MAADCSLRMTAHPAVLDRNFLRMPGVVGIEECDVWLCRDLPRCITSGTRAGVVFLTYDAYPVGTVGIPDTFETLRGLVLAEIVNEDQLRRTRRLQCDGSHRALDCFRAVIARHDHGDGRTHARRNADVSAPLSARAVRVTNGLSRFSTRQEALCGRH